MTDFQVGDRVSVEGVVERRVSVPSANPSGDPCWEVRFTGIENAKWMFASDLTLVERARRKLRVGSVWECVGHKRYVHIGKDMLTDWLCTDPPVHRSLTTIDERPDLWREVPVEELEREAGS